MRALWLTPVALAGFLDAGTARADDRAIALSAFQEGRDLMAAGRVAEACPKFAAAAQLSPTAGVRLNLAACYDKLGKTASAWAKANEALAIAERAGDTAATALAKAQIAGLAPRLAYLTIQVDADTASVAGLEVALDGEKVPAPVWGTALPIDPGEHQVTASAPGRPPLTTPARIPRDGVRTTLSVALAPEAHPEEPAPGIWTRKTAHVVALASGGLGLVGVGVGAAFGLAANGKKSDYQAGSVNGGCITLQCVTDNGAAIHDATASTVGFIVGGTLVAAGVVLWLTAPKEPGGARDVAVVPMAGSEGTGVLVRGTF